MIWELANDGLYHINLKPDDPRLGAFAVDGRLRYPTLDIFGKPVDRNTATVQGLNEQAFVVVPPYALHRVDIKLEDAAPAGAPERGKKIADKAPEA